MNLTSDMSWYEVINNTYKDGIMYLENEVEIDRNLKYNLHIIVPIIWSLIIFIGVFGKI